jgi:hypothetical protein
VLEALAAAVAVRPTRRNAWSRPRCRARSAAPVSPLAALLTSEKAPVDDRVRAAACSACSTTRAPRRCWWTPSGAARAAFARRSSARSDRRPSCRGQTVLAALAAGRTTAGRARPICCARCPRSSRAIRPCARRVGSLRAALAPERSFEVRGRAVMALGSLGGSGDAAALAEMREKGDEPVLRYLATRELAGLTPRGAACDRARPARRAHRRGSARARDGCGWRWAKQATPCPRRRLIAGAKQEPWPFVGAPNLRRSGSCARRRRRSDAARSRARTSTRCAAPALIGWSTARTGGRGPCCSKKLAQQTESATVRELARR